MVSFNFKLTISSSAIEPVTIALLVNPARIAQRAPTSLYTELPVLAFQVFEFSGKGELPAVVQFDSSFDAYLSGHTFRNTTTAASALPITASPTREFEVQPASNGSFSLMPVLEGFKFSGNKPVTITNLTRDFQTLGISDKHGNPYILMETRSNNSVQLLPELEFAVVIVSDQIQAGQSFSGHAARDFYTFLAAEVQSDISVAGTVTVVYDGTDIKVTTGNTSKPALKHPYTEKAFVVVELPTSTSTAPSAAPPAPAAPSTVPATAPTTATTAAPPASATPSTPTATPTPATTTSSAAPAAPTTTPAAPPSSAKPSASAAAPPPATTSSAAPAAPTTTTTTAAPPSSASTPSTPTAAPTAATTSSAAPATAPAPATVAPVCSTTPSTSAAAPTPAAAPSATPSTSTPASTSTTSPNPAAAPASTSTSTSLPVAVPSPVTPAPSSKAT